MTAQPLTVKPGGRIRLGKFDPAYKAGYDKKRGLTETDKHLAAVSDLEYRLYAEQQHAVLVVLQGMDAAGKDGTVRHVIRGLNPMSCDVVSFKQPTAVELSHDFLWRVHQRVPARGMITVFNRSHYEDVVTVRVHDLVPPKTWRERFATINAFEKDLADAGITILKFYLHISRNEQRRRLQARIDDPRRRWKLSASDLTERKLWPDYQQAYEDALTLCNTRHAPWHIVPADRKWYRNLVISRVLHQTLKRLNPQFPAAEPGIEKLIVK